VQVREQKTASTDLTGDATLELLERKLIGQSSIY
jgi:hypothetical protein